MVGLNALPLVEALQPAEIAGLAEGALLRHTKAWRKMMLMVHSEVTFSCLSQTSAAANLSYVEGFTQSRAQV